MTTVLLLGGSGFIGQNMARRLLDKGYTLISVLPENENHPVSFVEEKERYQLWKEFPQNQAFAAHKIHFIKGDISNIAFLNTFFRNLKESKVNLDFVLNLAGCSTIQKAKENKDFAWQVNFEGTKNLAELSFKYQQDLKIKGFIHASTDKVYGEGSRQTYHETDELHPLPYPYDESKAAADKWLREFAAETHFPIALLRFCNVYGPGDFHKNRIIPGNIYKTKYSNEIPLLKLWCNNQKQPQSFCRDMIYIDDLTRGIDLLMQQMKKDAFPFIGQAFNLGTGHCYEISHVMELLLKYLDCSIKPRIEVIEQGEIAQQSMNFEKAEKYFGFTPIYSLEEGLKATVDWYLKNGEKIYEYFE